MNAVIVGTQSITLDIDRNRGCNLADICDDNHLDIDFQCRGGACGACLVQVMEGSDNLSSRTGNEDILVSELVSDGHEFRLACQLRVFGPVRLEWLAPTDPRRRA